MHNNNKRSDTGARMQNIVEVDVVDDDRFVWMTIIRGFACTYFITIIVHCVRVPPTYVGTYMVVPNTYEFRDT